MNQRSMFKKLFFALAIILVVLPFVVTFSAVLTGFFNKIGWYVALQDFVVPFEARLVAILLSAAGISATVTPDSSFAMLLEKGDIYLPVDLQWNCLGWQSMVLLSLTLVSGLNGHWTNASRLQVVIIGILGTFLVNISRMAVITILAFYFNSLAAIIIHDYFAALVGIAWLFFFWWFSYTFVLEERS